MTVAELDLKLLCMKQKWTQKSAESLPEGLWNAVMDLWAVLVTQESVAAQPAKAPVSEIQVNGKQGNIEGEYILETEMGNRQEKENVGEDKSEAQTMQDKSHDIMTFWLYIQLIASITTTTFLMDDVMNTITQRATNDDIHMEGQGCRKGELKEVWTMQDKPANDTISTVHCEALFHNANKPCTMYKGPNGH